MSIWFYVDGPAGSSEGYERNLTNNFRPMWKLAGIEDILYSEDSKPVKEHTETLRKGLVWMIENPVKCREVEPKNGFGTYEDALHLVVDIHLAFVDYPDGTFYGSW